MPKPKTPPLPIGTAVNINIGQRHSVAQGVITAAEYDDGWLYRIDLTRGDNCKLHRNEAGELWVWNFEVTPR
jgi:hypothetical protein